MAKPTKIKKGKSEAAPAKKGAKKAARGAKAGPKAAPAKAKAKKPEKGGLRGRAARVQSARQSKAARKEKRGGAGKFLREVKVELSKVTWPTREELVQSTIVVVIAIAIAGVYIAVFDQLFTRLVELIT